MLVFLADSAFEVKGGQWWPEGCGGRRGGPAEGQGEAKRREEPGREDPGKQELGTWEASSPSVQDVGRGTKVRTGNVLLCLQL